MLPAGARTAAEALPLYASLPQIDEGTRVRLQQLREAVATRQLLDIAYRDEQNLCSERRVRPPGCFYWGKVWTLAAWCELRRDFRNFRIDRIQMLASTSERFRDEKGRTLADFLRHMQAQHRLSGQ